MKQINERTMTAVTAALLALCLCAAVLLGFVGYGREENEQTDGGSHTITEDAPLDGVLSPDESFDETPEEIPDGGEIILQKAVRVLDSDTPEALQARVMRQAEWIILPRAVEKVSKEMAGRK